MVTLEETLQVLVVEEVVLYLQTLLEEITTALQRLNKKSFI